MKNDPFIDLHWHYEVMGYQVEDKPTNRYKDFSMIDVVASSEKEAIKKAKEMLKKNHYRISKVYEHHSTSSGHEFQQEATVTQLKLQKELLDTIKGSL